MLEPKWYYLLPYEFGSPEIDLYTSRVNKQIDIYASWMPDPSSTIIDAMTISWSNKYVYIFPTFCMMWPVLRKI